MQKAEQKVLPLAWVERIFEKLTVSYGRDFLDRWAGFNEEAMQAVKNDWSMELGWYADHPDAIAFALAHLPAKAPSVIEFRALCKQAPQQAPVLKLDHTPAANPTRARQMAEQLKGALRAASAQDPKDWARQILRRSRAGHRYSAVALEKARLALGSEAQAILNG